MNMSKDKEKKKVVKLNLSQVCVNRESSSRRRVQMQLNPTPPRLHSPLLPRRNCMDHVRFIWLFCLFLLSSVASSPLSYY